MVHSILVISPLGFLKNSHERFSTQDLWPDSVKAKAHTILEVIEILAWPCKVSFRSGSTSMRAHLQLGLFSSRL
ncbi:hypothetical protein MPTK1_3g05410 [Marchantia polymorpha subsp. ruderalis]|uniref:Uncharacterized protein n=2 Tax=Marchantia polymorpha TaxID=3197 RepID=A0AAF6AXP3_MARPO|nr:hypothetical protein MARPO_0006s0014 [Marchantia polymorpha]BBN04527.1 hypothetical protein Mp_3g05410 [Marchantia polymorpha subsp. ruderalis]|eukprot:PTQ47963.1 hypothetical protein MARPO_0006s0014 [Marchantia polymorpha]